jgi:hypothetical protein
MSHWERFDLDFPPDFPVTSIDSLHAYLSDRDPGAPQITEWKEWSTGLNGLVHRFLGCDEHGRTAIASLRASASPPTVERHRQETALFGFFYEGLSCLECLYYALYFVGCLADASHFDVNINRRRLEPEFVARRYTGRYPTDRLAQSLAAVETSAEFDEWEAIRNFMSHRGLPGRTFYEGGASHRRVDWNVPIQNVDVSKLLDPDELQQRRDWLGRAVTEIVDAADAFARQHVP